MSEPVAEAEAEAEVEAGTGAEAGALAEARPLEVGLYEVGFDESAISYSITGACTLLRFATAPLSVGR